MTEFEMIRKYFATQLLHRPDVRIGIGDDAAIVKPPANYELAITTDTMNVGVHFPETTLASDVGYKALAVNLSDLAAMGATPAWATLAITLPEEDPDWLHGFCQGFFTLANRYHIQLIGGDTNRGPLSITIQAIGFTPEHQAILRSTALPTDLIYVTGTLGDAGLGLQLVKHLLTLHPNYQRYALERLHRPEPRIATGEQLRTLASSAIDISDGLAADLGHILTASHVGAEINLDDLPLSETLLDALPADKAVELALTAGDDYELCFTVPEKKRDEVEKRLSSMACRYTCIGRITREPGLKLLYKDGKTWHGTSSGYQHF